MKPLVQMSLWIFVILQLTACGGKTVIESDLGIKGAPDWVNEGTQAINDDDGRLIQGVGMAPMMGDTSLQKSTADNRARAEVARVLSTYIDATLSDYTASANGEADASIEQLVRSTTQQALSGAEILGHWKDEKSGDIYSFAELDIEKVAEKLAVVSDLSENFKQFYTKSTAANFDRFVEGK